MRDPAPATADLLARAYASVPGLMDARQAALDEALVSIERTAAGV